MNAPALAAEALPAELFPFALVFVRLGAALMLLPGLGHGGVPPRARLALAIALALAATPPLGVSLPPLPGSGAAAALLIAGEATVGLFFGAVARILFEALHVAGMVVSLQSGLAAATLFDPGQSEQTALFGGFLSLLAVVLLFVADLHHLLLRALVESYGLFPAGGGLPLAQGADAIARVVSAAFRIGLQVAAPVMVAGFLLYLGAGLLNRLMPQMMVFFVLLPVQIVVAFAVSMAALAAGLLWFADHFARAVAGLFAAF